MYVLIFTFSQLVVSANQPQCTAPVKVPVTESGHLTSQTTVNTDCGTSKAPWLLEAEPGQRVSTIGLGLQYINVIVIKEGFTILVFICDTPHCS